MKYEIVRNPVGMIDFTMNWGEKVTAEAAAMVYMRGDIETNTRTRKGGFLKSLKSTVLAGESFFVNEFTAQEDGCKLGLTGNVLGDIEKIGVSEGMDSPVGVVRGIHRRDNAGYPVAGIRQGHLWQQPVHAEGPSGPATCSWMPGAAYGRSISQRARR